MSSPTGRRRIDIVGYGCRLPGASDPDAFWALLRDGACAIRRIPSDRWGRDAFLSRDRAARGMTYADAAGVVDDPFGFDHAHFGVSPREAPQLDPQQRLLMMAAEDAVAMAGLPREALAGPRVGVFVGASGLDYGNTMYGDPGVGDVKFMTGNTLSIIANRIAHHYDAQGPSFVVDTACSSSLFALHAAAQALWRGEIDHAIVGGANMLLSPMPFVGFSRAGMLSPRGLCTPFDAAADGYVRAEGVVALALSAADAAAPLGLVSRGEVAGAGVNSDGAAMALSAPNGARQSDLMAAVRDEAGVRPDDIAFVEAHGTGTAVGDPVEAGAIAAALAVGRAAPLPMGSVKSNIGHLEPASGLAGVLKAAIALRRGTLPRTLHVDTPNPDIPFAEHNLALATAEVDLPALGASIAAVNSFGFGGTNAHVLIRRAPPVQGPGASARPAPLTLSAASEDDLRRYAGAWRAALEDADDGHAAALANHAAWRGARKPVRLAVGARDAAGQRAALDAFASGAPEGWRLERAGEDDAPTAFVYSGNGAQWAGMGRAAYRDDADFRAAMDATAALVAAEGGEDPVAAMHAPDLADRLTQASVAQPLLLSLQIAVTDALAIRGLRPAVTLGHSVGEVAAAYGAGVIDRAEAARLTVRRAARQAPLFGRGRMAAALAAARDVAAIIAEEGLEGVDIAADNSPRGVTLSGAPDAIEAFIAAARRRRLAVRRLKVDYPFHGPLMEEIREGLLADLADMRGRAGAAIFISTAAGEAVRGADVDAAHWWRNARRPVLFRQAVARAHAAGARVFLEIGPQPMLRNYIADTLTPLGARFSVSPSLERGDGRGDAESLDRVAAAAAAAGAAVDRAALFGPRAAPVDAPPRRPWSPTQHRLSPDATSLNVLRRGPDRPLLGWPARADETSWRTTLSQADHPWIADHQVDGVAVLPAAAFVEAAAAAALEALGQGPVTLDDFDVVRPLALSVGAQAALRTRYDAASGGVVIESRAEGDADWLEHARGVARRATDSAVAAVVEDAPAVDAGVADAALYAALSARGLEYGPAFRRAGPPTRDGAEAAASLAPGRFPDGAALDPTALDASMHLVAAIADGEADHAEQIGAEQIGAEQIGAEQIGAELVGADVCLVPTRIARLTLRQPGARPTAARARVLRRGARSLTARLTLFGVDGGVVAVADGVRLTAMKRRRGQTEPAAFWAESREPMDRPTAADRLGGDLAAVLTAAGAVVAAAPEPDEAALLADALARRSAWDSAKAIAPNGGVALNARRRLEPGAQQALALGLAALESDEAYDPQLDKVSDTPPAPPARDLTAAFLAVAPDRPQALAAAMRLRAALLPGQDKPPAALARRPGLSTVQAAGQAAVQALRVEDMLADADAAVSDALCAALRALAASRPDGARLATLLLDVDPAAARAALGAAAGRIATAPAADAASGPAAHGPAQAPFDLCVLGPKAMRDPAAAAAARAAAGPGAIIIGAAASLDLAGRMAAALCGAEEAAWPTGPRAPLARLGHAPDGRAEIALYGETTAAAPTPARLRRRLAVIGDCATAAALRAAAAEAGMEAGAAVDDAEEADVTLAPRTAFPHDPAAALAAVRDAAAARAGGGPLWLVCGEDAGAMAAARRVLVNETGADLGVLDAPAPAAQARAVVAAVLSAGREREIGLDAAGVAEVGRIAPAPTAEAAARRRAGREAAWRLRPDRTGGVDTLRWRPVARRSPGPGEIEIETAAAGLNFRDVMWALGALPEEAIEDGFAGVGLGMECAGVVSRAGPGVGLREGDAVFAFAADAMASHVVAPETAAAPLPRDVSLTAAASMPVVFATALHGLVELGALADGETALIHGAAGGVGLAAVQIAAARGARVVATAGAPEKRALLRLLGVEAAIDSRDPGFADHVVAATGGRGVDLALNSLSGEAMARTLELMAPFGRFIELGKRDYYAGAQTALRPLRRNVSYFGVDLDALLKAKPATGSQLLREVARGVAAGDYAPPPHRVFAPEAAGDAFRLMQRAGHIGKLLVRPPEAPAAADQAAPLARPDAAYLVVGGARGLGLAWARRLVARGARRVWLTSRSGDGDAAGVAALRAAGATAHVVACDGADEAAVAALLARIDADGAPLAGVSLAAMVLDDGLAADLTPARIDAVLRPKMRAAAVLDARTRGRPLEHFVLFSSVAATIGNPGQMAYAAANGALEATAARRRAAGLPGQAVAFGPIADVGVLAGDAAALARLERRGAGPLSTAAALDALEAALAAEGPAAVVAAPLRWGALAAELPVLAEPRFELLDRAPPPPTADSVGLRARLARMDRPAAIRALTEALRAEAAQILRQPANEIDVDAPLADLGFDSLMGVELKMSAEETFGTALPASALSEGATLTTVAARLAADFEGASPPPAEGPADGDEATLRALLSRHVSEDAEAASAQALRRSTGGEAGA